jgi:RNA polymerase primary sigma factor
MIGERGSRGGVEVVPQKDESHGEGNGSFDRNTTVTIEEQEKRAREMFGDKFDAFKKIKLGTNEEKMVARKFLVEKNLGLVRSIANKKLAKASSRDKSVEFSDLVSEGVFGLMKAIEAFDYSRGIAFSTFAYKHINGEINRFLENNGHIRVTVELRNLYNKYKKMIKEAEKTDKEITDEEIMKGLGIGQSTFDRLVESIPIIEGRVVRDVSSFGGGDDSNGEENPWDFAEDNRPSPEDDAMQRSEDRWLETLVESSLNNDEKNIITGRFGLDGGDEKTLEEIADERGITREAIRQKEAKALSKLRGAAPNHRPNESSFVTPDGPAKPIIESVCAEMGVKLGDIFGTDRSHDLSRARARICFEIKEQLNWTAKEIANFLDVKVGLVNNWIHKEKVRRRETMGDT